MNSERSCWWQEGGRCYIFDDELTIPRYPDGRSKVLCYGRCKGYWSKRKALGQFIPNDKLVITSEGKGD